MKKKLILFGVPFCSLLWSETTDISQSACVSEAMLLTTLYFGAGAKRRDVFGRFHLYGETSSFQIGLRGRPRMKLLIKKN